MEIRREPYNLQINDNSDILCPCCNNILIKEIKKGNYLIDYECGYCRYLDRPFGGCGNTATAHYGECSCKYGEKDYIYVICENCKSPKCIKCKQLISCCNKNCGLVICVKCDDEKTKFNNNWKTTLPKEKLHLYGIKKLVVLAKNKKIKGYSKNKKHELINENDFPITN